MYIPILKTRDKVEYPALKEIFPYLNNSIIPMIEIIKDNYINVEDTDHIQGQPLRMDVNTLEYIDNIVQGKKIFIDFFRFSVKKYGKRIDIKKNSLSFLLNRSEEYYIERLKTISKYPNMIPVISIKEGFKMNNEVLRKLIDEMSYENSSIAIRISEELYEEYSVLIAAILRSNDYLLFDIGNQDPHTKFMELSVVKVLPNSCKKILINAPREAKMKNGAFPERDVTDLIYTSAETEAIKYNFDGFGDYCGLKDDLKASGGSPFGCAIALFYDSKIMKFHAYVNKDYKLGVIGYRSLVPLIIDDKQILDKHNNCPVIDHVIKQMAIGKYGNWTTWLKYCVIRYIHQIHISN